MRAALGHSCADTAPKARRQSDLRCYQIQYPWLTGDRVRANSNTNRCSTCANQIDTQLAEITQFILGRPLRRD
jgi:hypothetical protein